MRAQQLQLQLENTKMKLQLENAQLRNLISTMRRDLQELQDFMLGALDSFGW